MQTDHKNHSGDQLSPMYPDDRHQDSPVIVLVSKQVPTFAQPVRSGYFQMSTYITSSLQEHPDQPILVIDLAPATILHIIYYCVHHNGIESRLIEPPLRSRRMHEVCEDVWDATFIDDVASCSSTALFELALGALYLQIQSLVHLACARLASNIKSHPLDKVKTILLGSPDQVVGSIPQRETNYPRGIPADIARTMQLLHDEDAAPRKKVEQSQRPPQ